MKKLWRQKDGEKMSWKRNFAANVRFNDLPAIGAFKIETEPESLGKGKFRVQLLLKAGGKRVLSTYEATIGDIVSITSDWVEAYEEKVGKEVYIRFRGC